MENLKKLMEMGIPVHRATFHQPVSNGNDEPKSQFLSSYPTKKKLEVKMSWVDGVIICFHCGRYFATPVTNVIWFEFNDQLVKRDGKELPSQLPMSDGKSNGNGSRKAPSSPPAE